MGKLGIYEYPDVGIGTAVRVVKTIVREKVERLETLATMLGHRNWKGGGFRAKLAAARRYGLLVGKTTSLSVSSLGKQIVDPRNQDERTRLLAEAVLNVDLFRRIYEKQGTTPPSGDFWLVLADFIDAQRGEIKTKAPRVESAYKEAVPILAAYERVRMDEEEKTPAPMGREAPEAGSWPAAEAETILLASPTDDLELRLPRTTSSISLAKSALDIIKEALKEKQPILERKPKKEEFDL
ncbi:MAG: hypothetical protein ACE5MG_13265 [Candidatus Methylomirabilales bacterium]